MEGQPLAASSFFVLGLCLLFVSAPTSFAFEQPAPSAAIAFVVAGLSLFLVSRLTTNGSDTDSRDVGTLPGKFKTQNTSNWRLFTVERLHQLSDPKLRHTWLILGLDTCALTLRVEVLRRLIERTDCTTSVGQVLPPFLIALYDYRSREKWLSGDSPQISHPAPKSLLDHVLPTSLLVAAGFATSSLEDSWRSTTICPLVGEQLWSTFLLQILGSFLDSIIFISFGKLRAYPHYGSDGKRWPTATLWAFVLLGAAVLWMIVGVVLLVHPFGIPEWNPKISSYYLEDTAKAAFLFTTLILAGYKAVCHVGVLTLSFIVSSTFTYVSLLSSLWRSMGVSPNISTSITCLSILLVHSAAYLWLRPIGPAKKQKASPLLTGMLCLLLLSFGILLGLATLQRKSSPYHPIDNLMSKSQSLHREWANDARRSTNLREAVAEYEKRYKNAPPPGFDVWYTYATNRSSLIIDNFDQIYHDLLPFRALEPNDLRGRTTSLASNPWNEVAAVIIRNGVAEPQVDILPTHRWMIYGIVEMITPFAAYLPDMDIAFNLNDECRVAVPWEDMQSLRYKAQENLQSKPKALVQEWPSNRASSWAMNALAKQDYDSAFENLSFQKTFNYVARPLCSPASKTRKEYIWDHHSLCLSCVQPHSLEQFVQDWTLSADVCHQPDLAFLHGFFLAPASFKVSKTLFPVFSQSKVARFNDILYPSSWNYIDKVKYEPSRDHPDPPYAQKEPSLFWRGSTSEGSSGDGSWKGITRQRLVHLANNHTSNPVTLLLPSSPQSKKHSYQTMPATSLSSAVNFNISFAEQIVRCAHSDCGQQAAEFRTTPGTSFQSHWSHRFLFDMDGAGFSGRFLPFLQSHSVPFRTGLFRQWLDSRLTPWLHFVPQDLRLHDVYSTLAYFAGIKVTEDSSNAIPHPHKAKEQGARVLMKSHDRQGEFIAEEGRKWAETTLRKEDMEIYMFRLLLEWGRLTDDRRDELGFTI